LYPFSEHTCVHRHSHGSRKLLVIEGVESPKPGVSIMSSIPLDLERRFERRWGARFVRQGAEPPAGKSEDRRLGQRLGVAAKAKRKTRMAGPAGFKSARTV